MEQHSFLKNKHKNDTYQNLKADWKVRLQKKQVRILLPCVGRKVDRPTNKRGASQKHSAK